jgi:hypothetical protein
LTLLQSNPEFFQKIAVEIEEETKKGKDQMAAAMTVMQRHQDELKIQLQIRSGLLEC